MDEMMDKERARFVLRCFRPDGADAGSEEFAAALRLAAADRELGEWLARERGRDAVFASVLQQVDLPEGLREEILAGFHAETDGGSERDETDAALGAALADIAPPEGLRGEILLAMERTAAETVPHRRNRWRLALPLAAAAGIGLALLLSERGGDESAGDTTASAGGSAEAGGVVNVSRIIDRSIATLSSPDFTFDATGTDHQKLFRFIRGRGRAWPQGAVPEGLRDLPSIGCRMFEIDGRPGAIICFRKADGEIVHLITLRCGDLGGEPVEPRPDKVFRRGAWSAVPWREGEQLLVLLGKTGPEELRRMF